MIKKIQASIKKFEVPKLYFTRKRVGIQIGEKSIKIVELKRSKGRWETKQTVIEELPKGMVQEGKILKPELLGLKIKELLTHHNINVKKVSVFVEELPFFIRNIHLPNMSKKEREQAIYYNTQLEIPVDPSELTIRYSLFQRDDLNEGKPCEYIIFAVYSSIIEKVVQTIRAADLSIYTFGIEPDAIYQGLKEKNIMEERKDSFMIVRTDTQRMLLAIYNNGKLVKSRYVPFSLDKSKWEQEIQRTIVSWNGKNQHNRIQEVLLLGEKDHWDEVKQRIEEFMPLSVRLVTSPFTACLGISLKNPNENDFYTDKHMLDTDQFSVSAKVIIPMATLVVITLSYILIRPLILQHEVNDLREKVIQSNEVIELVKEEKLLRVKNADLLTIKDDIEQKQLDILSFIRTVASHQPAKLQLTEMIFSKELVSFSGKSTNQEDVIVFFKELQKDPQFQNAQLAQSSEGTEGVQFVIEINNKQTSGDKAGANTK